MIKIINKKEYLKTKKYVIDEENRWDFPLDEIDYLLQEHEGETFLLLDDRLYEIIEKEEMN